MRRAKSERLKLLVVLGVLSTSLVLAFLLIARLDRLLVSESPLERADLIVVLAGSPERSLDAASVFSGGFAKRVWISRPARPRNHLRVEAEAGVRLMREEELHLAILTAKGVPTHAVCIFGSALDSTAAELTALRQILPREARTVVVVTSRLHTRRVRALLDRIFGADERHRFRVHAGPAPDAGAAPWWTDRETAHDVIFETVKLLRLYLAGSIPAATATTLACG